MLQCLQPITNKIGPLYRSLFSKTDIKAKVVLPDSGLIWVGNPERSDHDKHGMRNENVPDYSDILVLGNSQSYCKLITRDESWPVVISESLNKDVYNCSVNGWSVFQMNLALKKFIKMRPKLVLLTVYPGFEIYETFKTIRVSSLPEARHFNTPERSQIPFINLTDTDHSRNILSQRLSKQGMHARSEILRKMRTEKFVNTKDVKINNTYYFLQDDWRSRSMDLDNPAVKEGLIIFKSIFADLLNTCCENNVALQVVMIPTKEYLCSQQKDKIETNYMAEIEKVGAQEQRIRDDLLAFFADSEVNVIDPTMALGLSLDKVFHPDTENGHYAPFGTKIIGEFISKKISGFMSE